jgi:hypothetical protein
VRSLPKRIASDRRSAPSLEGVVQRTGGVDPPSALRYLATAGNLLV